MRITLSDYAGDGKTLNSLLLLLLLLLFYAQGISDTEGEEKLVKKL